MIILDLNLGSLLLMKGKTQRHWLLPTKKVISIPIDLTFRTIQS
jgi:hypothetical protein